MKTFLSGIVIVLSSLLVFGQARPGVYPWSITLKVEDDLEQPVSAAKVNLSYLHDEQTEGLTDKNGAFSVSKSDRSWELGIDVQKSGYYRAHVSYELYLPGQFDERKVVTNRNATIKLTLKKIIKPIPMYAKRIEGGPPVFNQKVGYDLIAGDWVAPYGKGIETDIIFDGELNQKAKNDFDYKLTVSFPNQADGIQGFDSQSNGSEFHSMQNAPTNGYQRNVIRTMSRHPGLGTKEDMNNSNTNYYFRVRTKIDDGGNIVSAHYGKTYGDFMTFSYYFNPTPNDRNIEFDPKHNLSANLKPGEDVRQP